MLVSRRNNLPSATLKPLINHLVTTTSCLQEIKRSVPKFVINDSAQLRPSAPSPVASGTKSGDDTNSDSISSSKVQLVITHALWLVVVIKVDLSALKFLPQVYLCFRVLECH